jgi:hypothetical protein
LKRALRTVGRAFGVIVGIVAILGVVAVLRLMAGPIELEFLHDRAQREFETAGGKVRIAAGKVTVEWPGISQPVRLVLHDIKAIDDKAVELAAVPSIALSFEPRSVLAGRFAPTAVVIQRPVLDADIRKGGLLRAATPQKEAQPQARVAALVIEWLLSQHNDDRMLGRLDTVLIEGARLTLRDSQTGMTWTAPDATARLKRDETGVVIAADARFSNLGDPIVVSVVGNYSRDRSHITLETRLEGVRPSQFADLTPDASMLRGLDLPLAARLRVEANGSGEIESINADLVGTNGRITLPGILPVTHRVQSLTAEFVYDNLTQSIKKARVIGDFGAARIDLNGSGVVKDEILTFAGRVEVGRIPVDRVGDYWPIEFAKGGREWTVANVNGGEADVSAEFAFNGKLGELDNLKVERAVAFLDYRDLNVRYMPEMPPLQGLSGKARFEGGTIRFDIAGARAANLAVAGATVEMSGLDAPTQYASIKAPISGQAPAVMDMLLRPKLGLPKDMLYDPKRVAGDVAIDLTVRFPLLNSLTLDELELRAEAAVSGFVLRDALGKVDLTEGAARIVYSGPDLWLNGRAKIDGNFFDIDWREQFGAKAPFRRRYEVKGTAPAAMLPKAGLPDVEPAISGPVGINLTYQVAINGTSEVNGKFDLKAAKAEVPPLGWKKDVGAEGQANAIVRMAANGKLTTIDFDGRGAGLTTKGQVRFTGDNALQQVTFQQLAIGRTDLSADWRKTATGMEMAVRGRSLEWARVRQVLQQREDEAEARAKTGAPPTPSTLRVAVSLALDQVVVERGTLGDARGSFEIVGERLNFADISSSASGGTTFRVAPSGQGRTIKLNINNLGQLLRNAGWVDGLVGGWLAFDGRFDDSQRIAPVMGKLSAGQFRMEKVGERPGVGTFNSTIEALNRAGDPLQMYEILEADVVKKGDIIELRKGRTNGRSIGLTAQGTIDLDQDQVKLRGTVVPSFAFNNALSNVPLLGPLLTGGKDGGLIAITYRLEGPLDDPKSSINMMSAITPGALREIFNSEGGTSNGDVQQNNPEMKQAP